MHRQIIFFDIDGTLTSEKDGTIPGTVPYAFSSARKNGHLLFLCSGRCFCHIEERFRNLGPDGIICGCGTHIMTEDSGEILRHRLSQEETALIRDTARKYGIDILYESAETIGFDPCCKLQSANERRLADILRKDLGCYYTDPDQTGFTCDKICIFTEDPSALSRFTEKTAHLLNRIDRGGSLYEMVPKDFSKATGIQTVLNHYGMSREDSWAFGDSNNDLAMLQFVRYPIVMGNAKPDELREIAFYVAPKASDDGIMTALRELGFIGVS